MNVKNGFDERERKDLPEDATPKQRLRFIKDLALFTKAMFGDISYNEMQSFIDKIIEVSNDNR